MSGGSFESSQRTEPVCASRFSSIKNCFKTRASGLARGRGWSRESDTVVGAAAAAGAAVAQTTSLLGLLPHKPALAAL